MKSKKAIETVAGLEVTLQTWTSALIAAKPAAARHLGLNDADVDVVAADAAIEAVASGVQDALLLARIAAGRARLRAIDTIRRRQGRGSARRRIDPLLDLRAEIMVDALPLSPVEDRQRCLFREIAALLTSLPPGEKAAIVRSLSESRLPLSPAERQAKRRAVHRLRMIFAAQLPSKMEKPLDFPKVLRIEDNVNRLPMTAKRATIRSRNSLQKNRCLSTRQCGDHVERVGELGVEIDEIGGRDRTRGCKSLADGVSTDSKRVRDPFPDLRTDSQGPYPADRGASIASGTTCPTRRHRGKAHHGGT